jgi:hypothetical protein
MNRNVLILNLFLSPIAFVPVLATETRGYVVSVIGQEGYAGPADCPVGLAYQPAGGDERWLRKLRNTADLAPEDVARVNDASDPKALAPQKREPGYNVYYSLYDGTSVCNDPRIVLDRFPDYPAAPTVQGKVAKGMNLDGQVKPGDFESPSGEQGIDNQLFRATGCTRAWRPGQRTGASSERTLFFDGFEIDNYKNGDNTILLEIAGVDDWVNDEAIQVRYYTGADRVRVDALGKVVPYTSQTIDANSRLQGVLNGRIRNGSIETSPADVHMRRSWFEYPGEHFFRDARLKLTIAPDGSLSGTIAGYRDIRTWWLAPMATHYGRVLPLDLVDCPGLYKALFELADGGKDPKTGKFTALSSSYYLEAVPAFVRHPKVVAASGRP